MAKVSLNEVRKVLDYNPKTGEIRRKVSRGGASAGDIAGYINQGYRKIRINGGKFQAHRIAWLLFHGSFPAGQIDHINGKTVDNRIENLRDVSNLENQKNQKVPRNSTTGCIGVSWVKVRRKYHVHICVEGIRIWLGYFENLKDAIKARQKADIKYGFHENHGRVVP